MFFFYILGLETNQPQHSHLNSRSGDTINIRASTTRWLQSKETNYRVQRKGRCWINMSWDLPYWGRRRIVLDVNYGLIYCACAFNNMCLQQYVPSTHCESVRSCIHLHSRVKPPHVPLKRFGIFEQLISGQVGATRWQLLKGPGTKKRYGATTTMWTELHITRVCATSTDCTLLDSLTDHTFCHWRMVSFTYHCSSFQRCRWQAVRQGNTFSFIGATTRCTELHPSTIETEKEDQA